MTEYRRQTSCKLPRNRNGSEGTGWFCHGIDPTILEDGEGFGDLTYEKVDPTKGLTSIVGRDGVK